MEAARKTGPKEGLEARLAAALEEDFSGWDFSRLRGRMVEDELPWSYRAILEEALPRASSFLDMGTGGGEFLSSLKGLPPTALATEAYAPNLGLARARLRPLGIEVREVKDDRALPFSDGFFDLVANRHESYSVAEVARILKPGGIFVTQQVGGLNDLDLNASLGAKGPDYLGWCLTGARADLLAGGLEPGYFDEYLGKTRFTDLEALVYYLKCIPWQIEDFSLEAYLPRLRLLEEEFAARGHRDSILHRFILVARKP